MSDLRARLLTIFRGEHDEHVQRIREILAAVDPAGPAPAAADLDEIFRRAHSLKGAARAVDLRVLETLAHRLETLLSHVREGRRRLDRPFVDLVRQVLDASEDWLGTNGGPDASAAATRALAALDELVATPAAAASVASAAPAPAAARAETASVPSPVPVVPSSATPPAPAPSTAPGAAGDTVRLHAAGLDRLGQSADGLLVESLRRRDGSRHLASANARVRDTSVERDRVQRRSRRAFQLLDETPDLAPASRYLKYLEDQVRVLSGEIGRALHDERRDAASLHALAGELARDVAAVRMIPASDVFAGFRRMVRDLARDAGKRAELTEAGLHVEADRVVLQALRDPIRHVLRNAVSHGLEDDAGRTKAGKDATGRIHLHIDTDGNHLRVIIDDDGRGFDPTRIGDIAVRRGLLTDDERAAATPTALMRLVLLPGFSTADRVSDLSGRGMGLSVVAEAVAKLQGTVDVGASPSGGARVSIEAPLVVSTHRLLFVRVQDQRIGIPIRSVERVLRVPVADVHDVDSRASIIVDAKTIPLVSLGHLLGFADRPVDTADGTMAALLMRAGDRHVAVAVDACLHDHDAVIRNIPAPADRNRRLAGAVLLEDGSISLVVSPMELLAGVRGAAGVLVVSPPSTAPAAAPKSDRILIVDDSITTRTLEKSVLEAHGYRVATAVDGLDALKYLRAEPVGLVVSDLQMPRLDGFGLLEEMKRDARLAHIPVILVSSVENSEVQARGLALGADAYIVKRKFEQQELLQTIRQAL